MNNQKSLIFNKGHTFISFSLKITIVILILLIFTAIIFLYFKNPNNLSTNKNQKSTDKITPTSTPSGSCFLDGKTYKVGDSFTATDGCNICTCKYQNVISCSLKKCSKMGN